MAVKIGNQPRDERNHQVEARLIEPLICERADLLEKTAIAEVKSSP